MGQVYHPPKAKGALQKEGRKAIGTREKECCEMLPSDISTRIMNTEQLCLPAYVCKTQNYTSRRGTSGNSAGMGEEHKCGVGAELSVELRTDGSGKAVERG